jgi:uncharacterized protein YdaU (DUF1376 family)
MAKEKKPYMKFYGNEWYMDGNVQRLTYRQQGIYLQLCWSCWKEGSIPDDEHAVFLMLKNDPEWAATCHRSGIDLASGWHTDWLTLRSLFEADGGRLFHQKVEKIRNDSNEYSETQAKRARLRWEKHKSDAKVMPNECQTASQIAAKPMPPISDIRYPNSKEATLSSGEGGSVSGALPLDEFFEKRYAIHPKKKDRGLAERALAEVPGIETVAVQAKFAKGHDLWIGCADWAWNHGVKAPPFAEFIKDGTWRYIPADVRAEREELKRLGVEIDYDD